MPCRIRDLCSVPLMTPGAGSQTFMAALEVGHAVLADQDDYDIDGVSLTLSKETVATLGKSAATLMSLDTWAPHPAAPGTHDFIDVVLQAFHSAHGTTHLRTKPTSGMKQSRCTVRFCVVPSHGS